MNEIKTLLDPVRNFGKVSVSGGYDDLMTVINLNSGEGAKLPNPSSPGSGPFNLVWWNSTDYYDPTDDPNREIIRVTDRSIDILTVTRAQEGTGIIADVRGNTHNLSGKTYRMILTFTAKYLPDIQADSQYKVDTHASLTTGTHGVGGSTIESVAGSQSKVDTHAVLTTGTHGVGGSTIESIAGSQSKVNTHSALTTGTHGVGGSTIESIAGSQSKVNTHATLTASIHNFDSSGNSPAQTHGNERHTAAYVTVLAGWNIYFVNTPSANIKISNDAVVSVPFAWTKLKTITFTDGFYGTVRIYWTIYNSGASSEETYSQIYKNGVAFGPSHHVYPSPYSVPSTQYDDLTISMNSGETIELWASSQFGPSYTTINNFRIAYDTAIIPRTTNT